jgi:hypothetical protein
VRPLPGGATAAIRANIGHRGVHVAIRTGRPRTWPSRAVESPTPEPRLAQRSKNSSQDLITRDVNDDGGYCVSTPVETSIVILFFVF